MSNEAQNPVKSPETGTIKAKVELPTGIMLDLEFSPETTVRALYDELSVSLSISHYILMAASVDGYREIYPDHAQSARGEITVKSVVEAPGFKYLYIGYELAYA